MTKQTKIGIYSGTFDPIHDGHIAFARQALEQCKLDKVFFLVEPRPRRKQGVKALEHRTTMASLALETEANLGQIIIEHTQFTVTKTLPVLLARFPGARLHLLMGDDNLMHLADWPHINDLVKAVCFTIGVRHDSSLIEVEKRIATLEHTRNLRFKSDTFTAHAGSVSSTEIRRQLRNGETSESIAPAVMDYIREQNLYTSSASSK